MMPAEHWILSKIRELRDELKSKADSEENARIKSMVNTQLQLAELLATELYNPEA